MTQTAPKYVGETQISTDTTFKLVKTPGRMHLVLIQVLMAQKHLRSVTAMLVAYLKKLLGKLLAFPVVK